MHSVSVRLSPAELQAVDAKRGRLRRGEWMRMSSLDRLPITVPAINAKAYQELNRLGVTLNQIAKAANSGKQVDRLEVRQLIAELRLALVAADATSNLEEEP